MRNLYVHNFTDEFMANIQNVNFSFLLFFFRLSIHRRTGETNINNQTHLVDTLNWRKVGKVFQWKLWMSLEITHNGKCDMNSPFINDCFFFLLVSSHKYLINRIILFEHYYLFFPPFFSYGKVDSKTIYEIKSSH